MIARQFAAEHAIRLSVNLGAARTLETPVGLSRASQRLTVEFEVRLQRWIQHRKRHESFLRKLRQHGGS